MNEAEDDRIRRTASADAEKMRLEAAVLTQNPLLIQKIIAEKLSDKVQIMMVPNDGKFFFANDVLKGAMPVVAQWIGNALPLTYYLTILRGIMLKGIGIDHLWHETLILSTFAVGLIVVSVKRFSKTVT